MGDLTELQQLSNLIDNYADARQDRLDLAKELSKLETREKALKAKVIVAMQNGNMRHAGGVKAYVNRKTKVKPVATSWPDIHRYIILNGATDLLQKRLHEGAVKLRWDDDILLPGIDRFDVDDLSIGKAKHE